MSSIQPGYHGVSSRGPGVLTVVLVSILSSIIASAVTVVVLDRYGLPGLLSKDEAAFIEVPELVGLRQDAADEIMRARGLRMVVNAHKDDAQPAETVLAQKPLAGSQVRKGDPISVTLSTGTPPQSEVPAVLSRTLAEAKLLIEQAGLKVGEIQHTTEGEPGTVTAATPAPGEKVAPGSAVVLQVAKEELVKVPELIGMSVRKAKEKIEAAGLPLGKVRERYDRRKRGNLVLEQEPSPGTEVTKDTQVALIVNQGDY